MYCNVMYCTHVLLNIYITKINKTHSKLKVIIHKYQKDHTLVHVLCTCLHIIQIHAHIEKTRLQHGCGNLVTRLLSFGCHKVVTSWPKGPPPCKTPGIDTFSTL